MPPKVKFQKEEIVQAALDVIRQKGVSALSAREVATKLGVSTRPIFTYFASMEQLKAEVYAAAKEQYRQCLEKGLTESIPFLGVWKQFLGFAKKEPQLYRLLFLTPPDSISGGVQESLRLSQALARESLMRVYHMDEKTADCYFRDIWLVAFSFATLTVTGNCAYTDEEIFNIGAEISLSVCKAYKEIPGLPEGNYDKDSLFRQLIQQ